ncbi:MAG: hypothetical protein ACXADY_19725 [Candidatus Hodarchaeales archaeon]|jgi:hypothetical protein
MFPTIPVNKPVEYTNTHKRIIERQDIHLFCVKTNPDELQALPRSSLPLEEKEVYLLVNQVLRKIFLWVCLAAPARSKFVGVHSANIIQRETESVYRVENVDQRSKSNDFLQTLAVIEA